MIWFANVHKKPYAFKLILIRLKRQCNPFLCHYITKETGCTMQQESYVVNVKRFALFKYFDSNGILVRSWPAWIYLACMCNVHMCSLTSWHDAFVCEIQKLFSHLISLNFNLVSVFINFNLPYTGAWFRTDSELSQTM